MSSRISSPFFLVGPTASGKSALAAALAARVGGEIVNADAFQLYQGMDLLTAKPTAEEQAQVPHHLYGVLPLTEACDAQQYAALAQGVIADIQSRGRIPIVVGGSGLYIKALTHGLAPLPAPDPDIRAQVNALSAEEARAQLLALDPAAGANVPLANPRYVSRALEICLQTGRPQSELRQTFAQAEAAGPGAVLSWEREALYARINERALAMLRQGLLAEVAALPELGPTAEKAIGLREMQAHLRGELSLDAAVEQLQQATRRYAKRQTTWFRRETWMQTICLTPESTAESALHSLLTAFPCLLNPPPPPPQPTPLP